MSKGNLVVAGLGYKTEPPDPRVLYSGGLDDVVTNVYERLSDYRCVIFAQLIGSEFWPPVVLKPKPHVQVTAIPVKRNMAGLEKQRVFNAAFGMPDIIRILDYEYTMLNEYLTPVMTLLPAKTLLHCHDWLTSKVLVEMKKRTGTPSIFTVHMSTNRIETIDYVEILRMVEERRVTSNDVRGRVPGLDVRLLQEAEGCQFADIVHCVSHHVAKSIRKAYRVSSDKVVVIHNGVDIRKYNVVEEKDPKIERVIRKYGLKKPFILSTGRFVREKGHKELIEAFKRFSQSHPDYSLAIFGFDGYMESILLNEKEKLSPQLRDRVVISGQDIRPDLIALYQSCDIAAFPSHEEAFGIVALEAMACGKPVVVGDIGGFKETVIEDETGTRVRSQDPKSISDGLEKASTHTEEWGMKARRHVEENFSWDQIAQKYDALIYSKLL